MNVPFVSSGAMSRAHYALVRHVEEASSTSIADRHIIGEIQSIRSRLSHPHMSLKDSRECLVMLLYCSMTATLGVIAAGELGFALPHAITLAETGRTVSEKRIGYIFCAEIMPPNHELQLMLVNTLRKDLESFEIPRVCLALDTLISSSTADVIPAIQSRLHDLLSHNSAHVRRRALLAFRSISHHDPDVLKNITSKVRRRLKDPDSTVASAALSVVSEIIRADPTSEGKYRSSVNELLSYIWPIHGKKSRQLLLSKLLQTLRIVSLSPSSLLKLIDILQYASAHSDNTLVLDAFQLLSAAPIDVLSTVHPSPIAGVRHLLTSREPNEQYLFLKFLECLDPVLWAGTRPDVPTVLEGWEVEQVMKLLESRDPLLRNTTVRILQRVDPGIIQAFYQQALQNIPPSLTHPSKEECAVHLLEIAEVHTANDGELYAQCLKDIFGAIDAAENDNAVLERAVEKILVFVRSASEPFRVGCSAVLLTFLTEEVPLDSTLIVVVCALAAEYSGRLSVSPSDTLRALSKRLPSCPPSVQDASLLSMLILAVKCEEIPDEVRSSVKQLSLQAGRHIHHRCDQFLDLSNNKDKLSEIMTKAKSSSLPDFVLALSNYESDNVASRSRNTLSGSATSRSPPSAPRASQHLGKLRYTAYEPPLPPPRLRGRSHSQQSVSSSSRSDAGRHALSASRPGSRLSSAAYSEGRPSVDELSKTVTAGDLALVGGDLLEMAARSLPTKDAPDPQQDGPEASSVSSRIDLISLDSPFISDPATRSEPDVEHDFESTWNALEQSTARGWCEFSSEEVIRRLQALQYSLIVISADRPPFEGDLKALVSRNPGILDDVGAGHAALRLRESEENSCLWRLRCEDVELRTQINRLLAGA